MSARQKQLMHGMPERSPQGNTSKLLSQRDPARPPCCAEGCKHSTIQHGVSSRWGPRARERHGAALQGLKALVLRWGWHGAHTPDSLLQRMGKGEEMMALESRGSLFAPEEVL